ncbi:MAG: hypothetical protein R2771_11395 [Saprospiraceae bacterium]
MKKILLISIFIMSYTVVFSQIQDTIQYKYCELSIISKPMSFSAKYYLTVNYGYDEIWEAIKDENGKNKEFKSIIQCLNYMGEKGWKLIDRYIKNGATGEEIHCILEKSIKPISDQ